MTVDDYITNFQQFQVGRVGSRVVMREGGGVQLMPLSVRSSACGSDNRVSSPAWGSSDRVGAAERTRACLTLPSWLTPTPLCNFSTARPQVELQFSLQLCEENGMAEEDQRAVAAGHEMLKNIWRRIMALNPTIVKVMLGGEL